MTDKTVNKTINDTKNIGPSIGGTLFERYFTGRHEWASTERKRSVENG